MKMPPNFPPDDSSCSESGRSRHPGGQSAMTGITVRFLLVEPDPNQTQRVQDAFRAAKIANPMLVVESARAAASLSATRLAQAVGEPPLRYLSRSRVTAAAARLSSSDATISSVAYESVSAFSKAFVRQFGTPPGRFRAKRQPQRETDR